MNSLLFPFPNYNELYIVFCLFLLHLGFALSNGMGKRKGTERKNSFWCLLSFNVNGGFDTFAVHGVEYAFGAHEYPTTGIFEGEPKKCDGFTFRKSILIGKTDVGPLEVRAVMEELAEQYKGNAYNLITKNCNHFCNDACVRLTGNSIPSWVNRLARIGKNWFGLFIYFPVCIIHLRL